MHIPNICGLLLQTSCAPQSVCMLGTLVSPLHKRLNRSRCRLSRSVHNGVYGCMDHRVMLWYSGSFRLTHRYRITIKVIMCSVKKVHVIFVPVIFVCSSYLKWLSIVEISRPIRKYGIYSAADKIQKSVVLLCFQIYNVSFSFELMQDAGLSKPKARPEGILLLKCRYNFSHCLELFFYLTV